MEEFQKSVSVDLKAADEADEVEDTDEPYP